MPRRGIPASATDRRLPNRRFLLGQRAHALTCSVGRQWPNVCEHSMSAAQASSSSSSRVLVVEDQDDIREFVAFVLQNEGYCVATADNGAVALEIVGRKPVGVVLLDMRMPVMDGWAFADAYRQQPGPHAPIVVLTAAQDAEARAAQINADSFLGKPFELDDLLSVVARYAGR
jgi:CheY-like chemotaxis protein